MPALVWNSGFEHGVAPTINGGGLFSNVTGGPTIEAAAKKSGNYGLRIYKTGTAALCYVNPPSTPATSIIVARLDFCYHTFPSSARSEIFCQCPSGSDHYIGIRSSDHALIAGVNGQVVPDVVGPVVSIDIWYRLNVRMVLNSGTFTVEWKIEESDQTQFVQTGVSGYTTWADHNLGFHLNAATGELWIDNVAFSITSGDYPISGVGKGLSPNGPGTSSPNPATKIYDNGGTLVNDASNPANIELDDVPISMNSDYIKQTTIGASDYVEVAFADLSDALSVNGARGLLAYMSSGTSLNNGTTKVIDEDGTGTNIFSGDMSESSMFYKSVQLPNPVGGWDQAAVNALKCRVGYSSDISPVPYWENLMIEVDYVVQTGATYNESPADAFSSTPACSHSTFVAISPSLAAFVSTPTLSRAASADLLGSVNLASTPSLSRAGAADFFSTITLPSTPVASMIGGMNLFNTLTFASTPAATMAYFLGIFPALTLASSPALSPSAVANFYSALTLASTPAAIMAAIGTLYASRTLSSSPAFAAVGGSDFFNSIALASSPALAAAVFKAAFPSLSLASVPALSVAARAKLPAGIIAASSPGYSAKGGFNFIEAIILASGGVFALISELTSGPIIPVGHERGESMTTKQAEEILVREMVSAAKRLSEKMEKRPAPKATRRDS